MCDGRRRAGRMVYPQGLSGGAFLGNGVRALDLFHRFPGDFSEATGMMATLARAIASCEDNGLGVFRTADGRLATLRSSSTQWDPVFPFEVFGRDGFVHATSRETVILSGRGAVIGPGPNQSWEDDWREFTAALRKGGSTAAPAARRSVWLTPSTKPARAGGPCACTGAERRGDRTVPLHYVEL